MEAQIAEELKKTHIYMCPTSMVNSTFEYQAAAEFLLQSTDPKMHSVGLWAVARFVKAGTYSYTYEMRRKGNWTPPYDQPWLQRFTETKKQILKKSIKLDPENSDAYNSLAEITPIFPPTILNDGRAFTKEMLLLKAAELGCGKAYCHLAKMSDITMNDGTELNKFELFAKAIECCPDDYTFYLEYVMAMPRYESIFNHSTRVQLLLEAEKRLIPQCLIPDAKRIRDTCRIYNLLATYTKPCESTTLHDGRVLNNNKLFIEALKCNDEDSLLHHYEISHDEPWCISSHRAFGKSNALFATLFLGLQKLEETGVIPLAHQAMFEEMLECYTYGDTKWVDDTKWVYDKCYH